MTLTPATVLRLDKKCGGSGIANDKKCNKTQSGSTPGNVLKTGLTAAVLGGAGYAAYKLGSAAVENHQRKQHNRKVRSRQPGNRVREAARAYMGFGAYVGTGDRRYMNSANRDSMYANGFSFEPDALLV